MALLDVEDLHVRYGAIVALRGMSLTVNQGEIVGLIGVNGAGKSTTMKAIMQVVRPERGTITYEGQSLIGMTPENVVRRGIAPVMEGRRIFPALTIEENLRLGAAIRNDRDGIKADMDKWCQFFPILGERLAKPAGTLSGGQQQMLAIGRGLMARPKVMLLDEPSLGLSPLLVKEIFAIVRRLNREQKVTMLLVEQNAKVALDVADFGYVMELGRIVMEGEASRLKESKDIQEFYLGVQETSQRGQKRWKQKKTWR
ncbi:MAG: ABC transporter ATP-binding protein [Thermomicrobiales bacterium]|nr:ABC transporter ATP-binding protein [Thermomicrobiales bacterium]